MRLFTNKYTPGEYHDDPEHTVRLRRVANIYGDFKPILWVVGEVGILRNESGKALGFYYENQGKSSWDTFDWREDIPVEFFNHQLKDVDGGTPEELAALMSEYGMIFDSWPGAINEMALYSRTVNVRKWGTPSIEEIESQIEQLDTHVSSVFPSEGRRKTKALWKAEYRRLEEYAKKGWEGYRPRTFMVSIEEVRENIDLVFDMADLAKAASQSDTEDDIARIVDIARYDFFDTILDLDRMLNDLLHVFHPMVGFQYIVDGEEGKPTYYCDQQDIHEEDGSEPASLMNAIALQLRNFNINLGSARQCSECGEVFIVKQTKRPSKRPHSDSMFCCDKCKNRYAQRKHRESPGYKLSQSRKRRAK